MRYIQFTIIILLATMATGCGGGTGHATGFGGPTGKGALLTYVQDVKIPAEIHAATAFNVVLTVELPVSMDIRWLGGPEHYLTPDDLLVRESSGRGGSIRILPLLDAQLDNNDAWPGTPVWTAATRDLTYTIGPLKAGTYTLYYFAAASREEAGGLGILHMPVYETGLEKDLAKFTQTITVLP